MVLKKSNSYLNSGATQRLTSHERIDVHTLGGLDPDSYISVVRVRKDDRRLLPFGNVGRTALSSQEEKRYVSAEEIILQYLDLDEHSTIFGLGPRVQVVESKACNLWQRRILAHTFSLDRAKMWFLPERFHNIMQNDEFAEEISKHADLKITEMRQKRGRPYVRTKQEWSSFDMVQQRGKTNNTKVMPNAQQLNHERVAKKSKRSCHPRGIQRPAMWQKETSNKKERILQEQMEERPAQTVYIDIVLPRQLDARDANCNFNVKRYNHRPYNAPRTASMKIKHLKSARLRAWHEEVNEESSLSYEADDKFSSQLGGQYGKLDSIDETDDTEAQRQSVKFNIMDFCKPNGTNRGPRKRNQRKKKKSCDMSQHLYEEPHLHIQYISMEEALEYLVDSTGDSRVLPGGQVDLALAVSENCCIDVAFDFVPDVNETSSDSSFEHLDMDGANCDDDTVRFYEGIANFAKDFR
ncbi:uncharacterized protein LOC101852685 [Aplysia californica]|uniref:Uncharacterized protein LOC101852685 n=1 Tax=Aplysia californica TaxID=6500 RepID=A0ABM0JLM7_APLCA|nr:uncharacterized protein LOC101852685 [Aplysia californica]